MNRADVTLAVLLAYIVAAALHAGLAASIQRRGHRRTEVRAFTAANWMLAAWHLLQGIEYTQALDLVVLRPGALQILLGAQLLVGMLVLTMFFQLFATFERVYRRRPPSLRAAITTHVHRYRRLYLPVVYGLVLVGSAVYLIDATGMARWLTTVRQTIGPTSAYLFGGSLLFLTFVLFPARAGQEKILIPTLGRSALLLSLGVTLVLILAWHDSHPRRTALGLIPWLNLQTVGFCVFVAFLRYEFSFLDRYVEGALRFLTWSLVVVACYFAFNRLVFVDPSYGRYATSMSRIAVLLVAVGGGPWLGSVVAVWADRVLFGRSEDFERAFRRVSRQLAGAASKRTLFDVTIENVARLVHVRHVAISTAESPPTEAEFPLRFRVRIAHESQTLGWILLGERRNLYPYFDGEQSYLRRVAGVLGAALARLQASGDSEPGPRSTATTDTEVTAELSPRIPGPTADEAPEAARRGGRFGLDPEWVSAVLEVGHDVADRDADVAAEILRRLHRMQSHLAVDETSWTELEAELEFARDYLALEKLRLRNRLDVDLSVEPRTHGWRVPRGMLQPLLENAFGHGIGRELRMGRVEVHAGLVEGELELAVLDNGGGFPMGFDPESLPTGGGLRRLQQHLDTIGQDQARLSIDLAASDGGEVRVRLSCPPAELPPIVS